MAEGVSINKFVSATGLCSRREADKWIDAGRVVLNGKVATRGNRVLPGDEVIVDGEKIQSKSKAKTVYLAFHKPPGVTSTTDPNDPDNIIDYINYPKRIFPIGRLDKASTGLILLTNDGDIVNHVLREEHGHEKEYIVTVDKPIDKAFITQMSSGVRILGKRTKKCEVEKLGKQAFRIVLTQGLNRQIRRMTFKLGYKVRTLKRVRIMNVQLGELKPGKWRHLTSSEVKGLKD